MDKSKKAEVAAIVVTFNRNDLLHRLIESLNGQTHPVSQIIIVDNANNHDTASMVKDFPRVYYLPMADNLGPAGGFAEGIKAGYETGAQWMWLFNDDAIPKASALETCLRTASMNGQRHRLGAVVPLTGSQARVEYGSLWRGNPKPIVRQPSSEPWEVDLAIFNGFLLNAEAVQVVGYPKSVYFMQFEEYEYCLRMKRAGFKILVEPAAWVDHFFAGSTNSSAPWRGYYQTRNHLAMALDHRSLGEILGWSARQVKFGAATLLYADLKRERFRLRLLGAWHGIRGTIGKTIDPVDYAQSHANRTQT